MYLESKICTHLRYRGTLRQSYDITYYIVQDLFGTCYIKQNLFTWPKSEHTYLCCLKFDFVSQLSSFNGNGLELLQKFVSPMLISSLLEAFPTVG